MLKITAALLLASVALAVPAPSSPLPAVGTTLTHAFEQSKLARRQTLGQGGSSTSEITSALAGLQQLLGKAVNSDGGSCSSQCAPWVSSLEGCVSDGGSDTAVGRCACRSNLVDQAKTCGNCFGGDDATNAENFGNLCETALGAGASGPSSSSSSSAASRSSSSSSSAASTPAADSDVGSSGTSAAAQTSRASVTNAGAPSSTPASGAGQVKAGGLILALAGAAALMV